METTFLVSFLLIITTTVNVQLTVSAGDDSPKCSNKMEIKIFKQSEPILCNDPDQELRILVQSGHEYVNVTTCEEVTVNCTLNQPVTWSYGGVGIPWIGNVRLIRDFDDCYTAIISVRVGANFPYGKTSIGRYTCSSINTQDNKMDYVQIFKADKEPIAFVQPAGINRNISYNGSNELIIPCMANWPFAHPTIMKETVDGSIQISDTKYNPQTGFHLQFDSNNRSDALGTYICEIGSEANASRAVFSVHENGDLDKPIQSEQVVINITRGETCSRFTCESRNKLEYELAFFPCQNIKHCEYQIIYAELAVQFPEESQSSDICDELDPSPGSLIRDKTQTGIVICREKGGNKYNFAHHYQRVMAPRLTNYAQGPKLIEGIDANVWNGTYYVNGTLEDATCFVSEFLFAEHPRWLVGLNGSIESQLGTVDITREHDIKILSLTIDITPEDIQSLVCAAPRWDSNEWVNQTFPLKIKRGTPPQLVNCSTETVYVNGSGKVDFIFVQHKGEPAANQRWTKNGEVIRSSKLKGGADNLREAIIIFKKTPEEDRGEYVCEVYNPAGSFTKTFNVVTEPSPLLQPITEKSPLIPVLIGSFSFVLILSVLVGLEMKIGILKRKLWRKVFSRLLPARYQLPSPSRRNSTANHGTHTDGHLSNIPSSVSLGPSGHPVQLVSSDFDELQPEGDEDSQRFPENSRPHRGLREDLEGAVSGASDACCVITQEDIRDENMTNESCGSFGIVYRICKGGREFALKRMKDDGNNSMKQLYAELRFFQTIGRHKNILGFEGAVKSKKLLGDIFIVTEYCSLKDIESYLNKYKKDFMDTIEDDKVLNPPPIMGPYAPANLIKHAGKLMRFTTIDIIHWAIECAAGMDFLTRQGHAHGDLAPRNLLLDGNRNLKISDFGLSRMLKNERETPYYRLSNESSPVPWDHYNLEFFDTGKITTLTDIWAYGVTVWEIFMLGEKPFAGEFNNYNEAYVEALRNGRRLPKPKNTTTDIYRIIASCWNPNPDERPSFEDLGKSFQAQLPAVPYVRFIPSTDADAVVQVHMNDNSSPDVAMEMSPPDSMGQCSMHAVVELPTEPNAANDTSQTDGNSYDDKDFFPGIYGSDDISSSSMRS